MSNFKSVHTPHSFDDVKRMLVRQDYKYLQRYSAMKKYFIVFKAPEKTDFSFLEYLKPHFGYKIQDDIVIISKNLKPEDYDNKHLWNFSLKQPITKKVIKKIKNLFVKYSKINLIYYVVNDEGKFLYKCDSEDDAIQWALNHIELIEKAGN